MTVNLDIEDGLVNGACGQFIMINYEKLQKTNETRGGTLHLLY